jgi:3D (Asp-Asp-Asp) domain-containing protein
MVTVVADGAESTFYTQARTVADLLAERGLAPAPGDYVSAAFTDPVTDGTRVVIRTSIPVRLAVGGTVRTVRSADASVADVLRNQHVRVGRSDVIEPPADSALEANETIRVVRVATWTAHEHRAIAPKTIERTDATLATGKVVTLADGSAGVRDTFVRFTRRDGASPQRTVLASRIIREPRARILVRGIATYSSLARLATQGFESAVHMAGSALHMIATAYTANCTGCSGITASGVRAGFGIIAVDPSVVPLGTKVFIPGYGRAVAGDTGGAIVGNRVDLGFDSETAAMNFGRRPVKLYILR